MTTSTYIYGDGSGNGRKKYRRPQAMLWSDLPPITSNGFLVPDGVEVNAAAAGDDFLIISDHNRKEISFKPERIEKRQRMINGRMRSYHVADKMTISTSWDMLPSRAFSVDPQFNVSSGALGNANIVLPGRQILDTSELQFTVDGGAGGNELLDWYNNHKGSFYVFLAYDKKGNFASNEYDHLAEYNEVIEMFISSFDYTVVKRGGSNFDFWNISVTLEEV